MVNAAPQGNDRYIVISSDNHAGADVLDYKPYLEQKWHEEFDVWAAQQSLHIDFPPSYVQAGSSVATLSTRDSHQQFGSADMNGYQVEWLRSWELAMGADHEHDLQELVNRNNVPWGVLPDQVAGIHDARGDARHLKLQHEAVQRYLV